MTPAIEAAGQNTSMVRILFVCLGNICRSPLAEGLYRKWLAEPGEEGKVEEGKVEVDSAGTGSWHIGQRADPRAIAEGERRGASMTMIARRVRSSDFNDFDLIVAMDRSNQADLESWEGSRPEKVVLLRSFDPTAAEADVPDPWYGGPPDFVETADIIERSLPGLHAAVIAIGTEPRSS